VSPLTLRARSASVVVDGDTVELMQGDQIPDGATTPSGIPVADVPGLAQPAGSKLPHELNPGEIQPVAAAIAAPDPQLLAHVAELEAKVAELTAALEKATKTKPPAKPPAKQASSGS